MIFNGKLKSRIKNITNEIKKILNPKNKIDRRNYKTRNEILLKSAAIIGLVAIMAFAVNPQISQTLATSAAKKKLPIYCVDTPDKKISISFDAAWGEGKYRLCDFTGVAWEYIQTQI